MQYALHKFCNDKFAYAITVSFCRTNADDLSFVDNFKNTAKRYMNDVLQQYAMSKPNLLGLYSDDAIIHVLNVNEDNPGKENNTNPKVSNIRGPVDNVEIVTSFLPKKKAFKYTFNEIHHMKTNSKSLIISRTNTAVGSASVKMPIEVLLNTNNDPSRSKLNSRQLSIGHNVDSDNNNVNMKPTNSQSYKG